ncbi:MAG: phosphopyruvate hydratase, partial [Acidiferrobacterales bacterium]
MKKRTIKDVIGRRVWDSRGRPTVEAEVRLAGGASGRAIAPAGASTGSGEATDLRDGGKVLGGYDVARAREHINTEIASALKGLDVTGQASLDQILIDLDGTDDKGRLGANALVAVSMAIAHAAAAAADIPLWQFLLKDAGAVLPLPQIQIFGGGAHADRQVDIQDFLVLPIGASSFADALAWTAAVYHKAAAIMAEGGQRYGVADEGGL